jgi:hypothetical protein
MLSEAEKIIIAQADLVSDSGRLIFSPDNPLGLYQFLMERSFLQDRRGPWIDAIWYITLQLLTGYWKHGCPTYQSKVQHLLTTIEEYSGIEIPAHDVPDERSFTSLVDQKVYFRVGTEIHFLPTP